MGNWRAYVVPALLVLLLGALSTAYFEGRKAGEYALRLHSADSVLAIRHSQTAKTDTLYVTKRDTTIRYVTRLRAFHDTLNIHDTVQVAHFGWLSDSIAAACSDALQSCDSVRAANAREIAALNAKMKLVQHAPPSPFLGAGAEAGYDLTSKKPALAVEALAGRTWSLRARAQLEIGDTTRSSLSLFLHRDF